MNDRNQEQVTRKLSVDEVRDAIDNGYAWCTTCQGFTCQVVEPDARRYTCDECDEPTAYGAEWALISGRLPI